MRVYVNVRVEPDPMEHQRGSFGQLSFSEDTQFNDAGFGTVARIFTRCHELLATIREEHDRSTPGAKLK